MKLSMRYALMGIGGLAVLSLAHWAREMGLGRDVPLYRYALGVLPNVASAVAIPFVVLGIWADQNADAPYARVKQWFLGLAAMAGVGLICWEFLQQGSRGLVFDVHDIVATLVGLGLALVLFLRVTPR